MTKRLKKKAKPVFIENKVESISEDEQNQLFF